MNRLIVSKHRLKAINRTLVVFAILAHLTRCEQGELIREGSIPVYKFHNQVQNIIQFEDDALLIAGLNKIYVLKDEYSTASNYRYFKKAFFSEPKNQHLSTSEFRNQSLIYLLSGSSLPAPDCLSSTSCVPTEQIQNTNRFLFKMKISGPVFYFICGTAYNGKCFFFAKTLIPKDAFTSDRFDLVASRKSGVLFNVDEKSNTFILAQEPDDRPKTMRPPLLSKLKLISFKNAKSSSQLKFKSIDHGREKAMINIGDEATLSNTRIHFIYGFTYERYAFVLKTEQREGQPMATRLGRVCLEDDSFFSYTEIQLACLNESSKSVLYTLASTAHFGVGDSYLSKISDVKLKTNTLFVTMNVYDNKQRSIDDSKGSLLCAFNIEQIMEHFSHAIESCYSGSTNPNIATMNQYSAIAKNNDACSKINKNYDYMCLGSGVDAYVEYRLNLMGISLFKFDNEVITSLASTLVNSKNTNLNTFVLGSQNGKIFKLARAFDEQLRMLHTFHIHNQSDPINPNPMISPYKNAYFTAGEHLIKYPMQSCAIYSTCKQCFHAVDNLKCGWCSVENQNAGGCMNEEECTSLGKDQIFKTSFLSDNCVPIIEKFSPQSGPLGGNTLLQIKGENLCNPLRFERNNNYKVDVTIGDQHCKLENCTEDGLTCLTSELKTASQNSNDPIKVCTVDKGVLEYSIDGCTVSLNKFHYTKPDVFNIEPTYGPIGGGTRVVLTGVNLNVGRNRLVKIKAVNCIEVSSNNSHLECIIEGREWRDDDIEQLKTINENGEILLEIDGNRYRLDRDDNPNIKFDFKPNPKVLNYSPKAGLRNVSTNITINGTYFTSAHRLQVKTSMYSIAKSSHIQLFNKCFMINNSTLNCRLPTVPDDIEINSAQSPLQAELSLVPDGSLANSTRIESNTISFYYYPLPKYKPNFLIRNIASINSKKHCSIELRGENLSDQYEFVIRLIKLDKESSHATNIDDMKFTDKQLLCTNAELRVSHSLIRCQIDLSNESIDSLLSTVWLVRVEFAEQDPFNVQLIEFKSSVAAATMSNLSIFFMLLLMGLGLIAGLILCMYRNNKIQFSRQKEFPHFNVSYTSDQSKDQTMMDAPFIRQSSQNGLQIHTGSKMFRPDHFNYKERLAEDNILIPEDCLKMIEKIGAGYFGCVYKGKLKLPTKDELIVAVKALKNSNPEDASQLIDEALRMKDFKHENVLTLIGVCLKDDSIPMIILPFMKNGDLLTFIRSEANFPTIRDLLGYAIDIGNGMKYLADLKYIHRDVAARNCMMDEKYSIKVADFGLTRDVYERNYYTSKQSKEIPIKWMAIETIDKYVSTVESDVWSYGVLLWELMTRGCVPYVGLDGYNLINFLKLGKRMPQPSSSPDSVYELMLDCWQANPKLRPTFDKIVERIKAIVSDSDYEECMSTYANLTVNYVNYPIEQYYSNTKKMESDHVNSRANRSTSPYYNSSLSITSPSSTYNTINGSTNPYSTLVTNQSTNSYPMSTFKSHQIDTVNKTIEMPDKKHITLQRTQEDANDETYKLSTLLKDTTLSSRKNSDSESNISSLSTKLNRQNAIDLNETDNKTYEYVMRTPQILVDKNKLTGSNENLDHNDGENIVEQTQFAHPIKYFK